MTDLADKLREQLSQSRSAPFLFVGAGMSRRYLELDDWADLLRRLAELTGKSYEYYFASANGDFPTVATLIAGAARRLVERGQIRRQPRSLRPRRPAVADGGPESRGQHLLH